MAVKKSTWRSLVTSCYTADCAPTKPKKTVTKTSSFQRLSMSDLSNPSSTLSEDLSISLAGSNLYAFTFAELKVITQSFSSSNFIGEGGFGPVHKGFLDDKIRPGLKAQSVAVKNLDLDGTQGHKEWLVSHLTAMSDVYSFGVVLLELISGRKSLDKSRPNREHNLVDWARPMLMEPRKLSRVMDPRLEGLYSETGARKAAALAYQCLSHRPKHRPTMSTVVQTLEPLTDFDDVSAPFVYTVPAESKNEDGTKENEENKEVKKDNGQGHHHNNHPLHHGHNRNRIRSPNSPKFYSENGVRQYHRSGLNSPLHGHHRAKGV
ncbi:hypothetical protein CsatA_019521 [Cannabis sativa]